MQHAGTDAQGIPPGGEALWAADVQDTTPEELAKVFREETPAAVREAWLAKATAPLKRERRGQWSTFGSDPVPLRQRREAAAGTLHASPREVTDELKEV